jgi:phosphohistidine swiveling domain-containing protein
MPAIYKKLMNRSYPLFICEWWEAGERVMLPRACQNVLRFTPLFWYTKGKGVGVYYDFSSLDQDPANLVALYRKNPEVFEQETKTFEKITKRIDELLHEEPIDLKAVNAAMLDAFSVITIIALFSKEYTRIDGPILAQSQELRQKNEQLLHIAAAAIINNLQKNLPEAYLPFIHFLRMEELITNTLPAVTELEDRAREYVLYKGTLYVGKNIVELEQQLDVSLVVPAAIPSTDELAGKPAYPGTVHGKVVVLFETQDIEQVDENSIIVSSMTTPDFMPAMKKAAAIVTDEGGMLCHASIAARELKKPCIVGTQYATTILKTGDTVEVDSTNGKVRKLTP